MTEHSVTRWTRAGRSRLSAPGSARLRRGSAWSWRGARRTRVRAIDVTLGAFDRSR